MDTVMIKCNELMVGDWVALNPNFPMQIEDAGDDYAYATWEGNEGDPWEFDDKDYQPQPIPITPEILVKNGWWRDTEGMWQHLETHLCIGKWNGRYHFYDIDQIKLYSVHQVQQVLRLSGMTDMANNFKI